jgi:hypothetical protein
LEKDSELAGAESSAHEFEVKATNDQQIQLNDGLLDGKIESDKDVTASPLGDALRGDRGSVDEADEIQSELPFDENVLSGNSQEKDSGSQSSQHEALHSEREDIDSDPVVSVKENHKNVVLGFEDAPEQPLFQKDSDDVSEKENRILVGSDVSESDLDSDAAESPEAKQVDTVDSAEDLLKSGYPYFVEKQWLPLEDCVDDKGSYDQLVNRIRTRVDQVCNGSSSSVNIYDEHYFEGINVAIDFSKRIIGHTEASYSPGFITADCSLKDNKSFRGPFAPSFIDSTPATCSKVIEETTILIHRDDCGNTWHSLADFAGTSFLEQSLGISPHDAKIIVSDSRLMCHGSYPEQDPTPREIDCLEPACPYVDSWRAMARNGVHRGIEFDGTVCFKRLLIPMSYYGEVWAGKLCSANVTFPKYSSTVLDYLGLIPKAKPTLEDPSIEILLIDRKVKPFSRAHTGRQFSHPEELAKSIQNADYSFRLRDRIISPKVHVNLVDLAVLNFREQLRIVSNSDIIAGMHGAGLSLMIYTPEHAHVLEMVPYTWKEDLFKRLAFKVKRHYWSWRNSYRHKHFNPECHELNSIPEDKNISQIYVCDRRGLDKTDVTVDEVTPLLKASIVQILTRATGAQS